MAPSLLGVTVSDDCADWVLWGGVWGGGALLTGCLCLDKRRLFGVGIGIVGISSSISGNSLSHKPKESRDSWSG